MDGHGISLSRTVSNKALLHPCVPYYPLRAMEHHFCSPKMSKFYQDFPLSSQVLPCLFWGRCQIPRLGVSCSSGAAFRVWFFFAFFGGNAKSLAWVFLARLVLPFVLGFFCCLFWGRCQIPRLGVSCSSGAAFRVWVLFLPFLGAMPNPSLGCFLLVGCLLNGWSWDQSI